MSRTRAFIHFMLAALMLKSVSAYFRQKHFECGPYGFTCESNSKLRLCDTDNLFGPSFLCPPNTICNEDSNDVCENNFNHFDPIVSKNIRCRRNERVADPNVPGCKGYILCTSNNGRFQGIKFKCSGNTIFNGFSRTCSSPEKYKCPISNLTRAKIELFEENRRIDTNIDDTVLVGSHRDTPVSQGRPIDCKNYKFTVTQDGAPVRAAYFCPPRPMRGEFNVRCTIFSNKFCITLARDDRDQFTQSLAYRKPRLH